MTAKERVQAALNHQSPDVTPVDFGTTTVTGIHCRVVEGLRDYYGLEKHPVRISDPFQMLGEVEPDLQEVMGVDCLPLSGPRNMFDLPQDDMHLQITPWGQEVMISAGIDLTTDNEGDVYIYARGDRNYPPCAKMPAGCYFIDATVRQEFVDDDTLRVEDNLEEYGPISDADLQHFSTRATEAAATGKAVVASFGGAALGDVAFIPGLGLKEPKGVRNVAEWYMSTAMRQDFVHELFERQTAIAIANYERLWNAVGDKVDVVFTCGTDFGTQDSQFCSPTTFRELWLPYYRRMNDWIHSHTGWKVFKHSCGSVLPLIPDFIEAGFDILNPVQVNAKGMDINLLKNEFGKDLVFWGGGVDTQRILPSATPEEVRSHILRQVEVLGRDGGFVFNAVHNVQANVPLENMVALIETLKELRK